MANRPQSTPIYRRPRFWAAALVAVVIAIGGSLWLATKQFTVTPFTEVKTGKIEIATTPEGATISIDGKEQQAKSPTTVSARTGERTIKLQLEGFDDQEVRVIVREGETPYELEHVFTRNGLTVLPTPAAGQSATKTYTNDRFGYTLSYPSSWSAETDPSGQAHFYNAANTERRKRNPNAEIEEGLAVLTLPNSQNLGPQAWYQAREEFAQEDQSQIKQQPITVNGQPAYQYDTPYGFVPYFTTIFTGKGNAYLLQQKSGSPDRQIYDQILQSFRLI